MKWVLFFILNALDYKRLIKRVKVEVLQYEIVIFLFQEQYICF